MRIKELLEVDPTPFPSRRVQPVSNSPRYGAQVIPMAPFQQERQLKAQRMQVQNSLDEFTHAYIVAALWSSSDDDDGEPLDRNHSIEDISDETLLEMVRDCKDFQQTYAELLAESGLSDEQAGHDFWLTRCGHGVGFWDRGLGEIGDRLTDAAHAYGNVDLYIGDDGKIYS